MSGNVVLDHLACRLPAFKPAARPEPLAGGLLNHVWRVPGQKGSVVVKHAPPHIATSPGVPLDPRRILFEARALAELDEGGRLAAVATPSARPPRLYDIDEATYVLVMEDVGPLPDLSTWIRAGHSGDGVGAALGGFIGRLHRASFEKDEWAEVFNNLPIQQARHAVQYSAVEALLREAGVEDASVLGVQAAALGERLQQRGCCLVQGDLWPPSVLVTPSEDLRIIDWEFTHFGHPAQDVAHLAAHLWMQAHRAPSRAVATAFRTVRDAFLKTYGAALEDRHDALLTPDALEACAVHFGAEILVRTVGAFQAGYLYDGLKPEAPAVREALIVAAEHLRVPAQVATFDALKESA